MWANSIGKTFKHLLTAVALPDGCRVLSEGTCQRASPYWQHGSGKLVL